MLFRSGCVCRRGAQIEYLLLLILAYAIPLGLAMGGLFSFWVMLTWLSIPLAVSLWGQMWREKGRALNATLAGTARLELVYSVLLSVGLVIQRGFG